MICAYFLDKFFDETQLLTSFIFTFILTFQLSFFYRVAEYIPPRPLFPKRTDGAQRVIIKDYHIYLFDTTISRQSVGVLYQYYRYH